MTRDELNRLQSEDVAAIAASCVNGATPPCAASCPFGLDVRAFIQKAEKGRDKMTFKAYRDAVVFPVLVSALCHAPCECACVRDEVGGAIDLLGIERSVVARMKNTRRDSYVIPPKSKRVAIVGAGVAGLSAALTLSLKRYGVTVFEASDVWGGALRSHELFSDFDEEFRTSFEPLDTDFRFGSAVTELSRLAEFDAIYVATGVDVPSLTATESLAGQGGNVFLGGALLGDELMQSIAFGRTVATQIEVFLQTGTVPPPAQNTCEWEPDPADFEPAARIQPADGAVFTAEEAMAESARCLKCDCDKCIRGCEMLARYHKLPQKIAVEVYTDTKANPPYSSRTLTRQAHSCNDCGYCASGCPKSINVADMTRLSRRTRIADGSVPPAFHDYWLREMDFSTGDAALVASAGATCDYVFFPGCQLGAYNPKHVTETLKLLRDSGLDVGVHLGCCGAPAWWAGDDERLDANTSAIRAEWARLGEPKFIFACSTCTRIFGEIMPEIEGVSLYKLLAEAGVGVSANAEFSAAAIFDPCSAREDEETQAAVRDLSAQVGSELSELSERGKCCGYGGLISIANPKFYEELTTKRASASELPYVVYCANCRSVFESRGKSCAHILDLALGLAPEAIPDIDRRRKNSLEVRRVAAEMFNTPIAENAKPWDTIELVVDAETAERIDRKLIALNELREAISLAEGAGTFFEREDGVRQCSQIKAALVYWVTYKPLRDNVFEISDAYYHRMKFEGVGKS